MNRNSAVPARDRMCVLCGLRPAINSHIIPKCFNLGDTTNKMIPVNPGDHPKRAPVGIYDRILCASCDQNWGRLDGYACEVLARGESHRLRFATLLGVSVPWINYSYYRLHTFFITMLWRALHSRHVYFAKIQNDALRSQLDSVVFGGDQDLADQHLVLFSYCHDIPYRGSIQPILRTCKSGEASFEAALFVMNNLHVTITFGAVPCFPSWEILNRHGSTTIVPVAFKNTYIAQATEGMVKNYPKAFGR